MFHFIIIIIIIIIKVQNIYTMKEIKYDWNFFHFWLIISFFPNLLYFYIPVEEVKSGGKKQANFKKTYSWGRPKDLLAKTLF